MFRYYNRDEKQNKKLLFYKELLVLFTLLEFILAVKPF
ncbi:hypothetical protein HMPREF0669_02023 [Prevotella sp. oral taxon 299 str. F0039]|nr:hypothetical protein HMPREF0669_02023 [Prevotella sp. oral taxon 299 str. F0039]